MAATHYTLRPRPRWTSGALTCLAMFALGGLVLWGLFRAPRTHAPPSPAQTPWGVPGRPIRVVCLDMGAWTRNALDAPELIRGIDPDVILAQRVPGDAVAPLAEALGMQRTFHPNNFVRLGRRTAPGCVVLSKHPIYDATPLRPEIHPDAPLGVWASVVIDGHRFAVASADAGARISGGGVPAFTAAVLLDARQEAVGRPPLVAAFRAPQMLSARAELLRKAELNDLTGSISPDGGDLGIAPLIAAAGQWKVLADNTRQSRTLAPGIVWVELGPE